MGRWIMVPGKEEALQTNTAVNNGIMAKQDESDDNAQADAGNQDNTPGTA